MRPSIRSSTTQPLHERLDQLLDDPNLRVPVLVGLVMRYRRVRPVLRALTSSDDLDLSPVPCCWRAVGLLVDVGVTRYGNATDGRMLHLVGRDGRHITRLSLEGGPPFSAFDGQGSLDDLCWRLLGLSPPRDRTENRP